MKQIDVSAPVLVRICQRCFDDVIECREEVCAVCKRELIRENTMRQQVWPPRQHSSLWDWVITVMVIGCLVLFVSVIGQYWLYSR